MDILCIAYHHWLLFRDEPHSWCSKRVSGIPRLTIITLSFLALCCFAIVLVGNSILGAGNITCLISLNQTKEPIEEF